MEGLVAEHVARIRLRRERRRRAGEERRRSLRAHLGPVTALLRDRYGCTRIVLFGSLARGDAHAGSDLDLAVWSLPAERYFPALADLMERVGAPVDLVRAEDAPGSLLERLRDEGEEL